MSTIEDDLQSALVELIDLSLQAKQAHWNVTGPNFRSLHQQLDEMTDQYRDWYDLVAERLRALVVFPDGRPGVVAVQGLERLMAGELRAEDVLAYFSRRLGTTADGLRGRIASCGNDLATQNIYIEVLAGIDKQRWMIRASM